MVGRLRFDSSARHGIALVGIVFAAYLNIATDFSTIIQAADYAGSIPNDVPYVNAVQFATILAIYLVSFSLLATTAMRRAIALTTVPLVLLGWAFLGIERGDGVLPLGAEPVWSVLLDQGFITVLVAVGGWLIVRGLHPLSWLALLTALIPPLVALPLDATTVDSTAYTLIIQGVVLVSGAAGVLIALGINRALGRRSVDLEEDRSAGTRSTRYGIALGLVIFATYLNIATDFTGYLQSTAIASSSSVSVLGLLQFLLILGLYVTALVIMPVSSARRLTAVTLVSVILLLWATLGIERSVGNITAPVVLWFFLLNQGFITLLVSLGGWLIVRGRHPLSFVVLGLAVVPPIVSRALDDSAVTSGAYTLVLEGVIVLGGLAGGGLAWAIDALLRRRSRVTAAEPAPHALRSRRSFAEGARPRGITVVAVIVWVGGAAQILTGAFSLAGQGLSGEDQRTGALVSALVTMVMGVARVLIGVGLLRGNRAVRVVVTFFVAISLLAAALAVVAAIAAGDPPLAAISVGAAALDVATLVLLWFGSARVYFRHGSGRAAPRPVSS
ncbi:MAG: hypothetical protein ABJA11_05730 [Pseudolysinimonas sp.]